MQLVNGTAHFLCLAGNIPCFYLYCWDVVIIFMSILKTLLVLRQCLGCLGYRRRQKVRKPSFSSFPVQGPLLNTAFLECTERPLWENPWLCLLISSHIYSLPISDASNTLGENVYHLCLQPAMIPFVIFSPHLGHWNRCAGKKIPFLGLLQVVMLTTPDLPWTVQRINR